MAIGEVVDVPTVVEGSSRTYCLTMTGGEIRALRDVLQRVDGSPESARMGEIDNIVSAINGIGVTYAKKARDMEGYINLYNI